MPLFKIPFRKCSRSRHFRSRAARMSGAARVLLRKDGAARVAVLRAHLRRRWPGRYTLRSRCQGGRARSIVGHWSVTVTERYAQLNPAHLDARELSAVTVDLSRPDGRFFNLGAD
jgi:hypothetical protein